MEVLERLTQRRCMKTGCIRRSEWTTDFDSLLAASDRPLGRSDRARPACLPV